METKLVGNPATLAVEFRQITLMGEAIYGCCALWLGGYRLHDADAPVSLDYVLACMQGVARSDALPSVASDLLSSPAEMLQAMQEQIGILRHFFLNIGGFDDFLKLFSKDRENTYLHWALHPQVAHLSIYNDYPKGVQRLVIGNVELLSVVDQFAKELEAAKAGAMPSVS